MGPVTGVERVGGRWTWQGGQGEATVLAAETWRDTGHKGAMGAYTPRPGAR